MIVAKWFLVVLLYRGEILADYEIYFGATEQECAEAKAVAEEREWLAHVRGLEQHLECVEIKRFPSKKREPPKGEEGTEQIL